MINYKSSRVQRFFPCFTLFVGCGRDAVSGPPSPQLFCNWRCLRRNCRFARSQPHLGPGTVGWEVGNSSVLGFRYSTMTLQWLSSNSTVTLILPSLGLKPCLRSPSIPSCGLHKAKILTQIWSGSTTPAPERSSWRLIGKWPVRSALYSDNSWFQVS